MGTGRTCLTPRVTPEAPKIVCVGGCVCIFPQEGLITVKLIVFMQETVSTCLWLQVHIRRPQFPFMLCSTRLFSFLLCWTWGPDKEAFVVAPDDPECTVPPWLITLTLLLPLHHAQTGHGGFLFLCVCCQRSYAS